MPFIKLTQIDSDFCEQDFKLVPKHIPYYLKTDTIIGLCVTEKGTQLDLLNHRLYFMLAKETPEEILRMIKEAEHER